MVCYLSHDWTKCITCYGRSVVISTLCSAVNSASTRMYLKSNKVKSFYQTRPCFLFLTAMWSQCDKPHDLLIPSGIMSAEVTVRW